MKSLSLAKPLIIITAGLPGAGKSFFASQFAATFGAPLISLDYMRSVLFDHSVLSSKEHANLVALAMFQLQELTKTKQTVLVDGLGLTKNERNHITKLAKEYTYNTLIVWVQTDEATAKTRAIKRPTSQAITHSSPITAEEYGQLIKRFKPPAKDEEYIVISGKHTYATQAKILLKKLTEERRETIPQAPQRPKASSTIANGRRHILIE